MSFVQLKQIWQILRLQAGPQTLPFSYALLLSLLAAHTLIDVVLGGSEALHWPNLLSAAGNTIFTAGFVFVLLQWSKKMPRFVQALSALLGIEVVIGLIGGVLLLIYQLPAFSILVSLLWLGLIAWNTIVAAHIFAQTLEMSMLWGMALAIVYTILAYNVVTAISAIGSGS